VNYLYKGEGKACLIDSNGVDTRSKQSVITDFKDQAWLNPRIKNCVCHTSLSFAPGEKISDRMMTEIAREYMEKMDVRDTQYILVRHTDREHPHCHLLYNRIDNRGNVIPDRNDRYRNEKACKELTRKYGLYFSPGKERVNVDRLREPDKTRYQIYHAVKSALPHCGSWIDLENRLRKQDVTLRFKYNGHSDRVQGVLFSKNGRTFSGSKVDRAFSFSKLDHRFSQGKTQNRAQVPTAGTSSVRQPVAPRVAPVVHTTQRTGVQYSSQSVGKLQTAIDGYLSAFGKSGFSAKDGGELDLNRFGGRGRIPLPPSDSGIGIPPEQMQRRIGESHEEYIARITALIAAVSEAILVRIVENNRRQQAKPKHQFKMKF